MDKLIEGLEITQLGSGPYVITLKEDLLPSEMEEFKKAWKATMCNAEHPKVTALCIPNTMDIESLEDKPLDLTLALQLLKLGHKITRDTWASRYWLDKAVHHQQIKLHLDNGAEEPWIPSSGDLLAEDYKLVKS